MPRTPARDHCKRVSPCARVRWAVSLLALLCSAAAQAFDPESLLADQLRKESVAPDCRVLVLQSAEGPPERTYKKALCLLYGLQTPPQVPLALALLRQAAAGGWVEAQVTLGDSLQRGGPADQIEALRWYTMAIAAGDVRATGRHARLLQRRQAMAAAVAETEVSGAPGFGDGMPVNPQGYHCHIAGLGKKYCHSAFD